MIIMIPKGKDNPDAPHWAALQCAAHVAKMSPRGTAPGITITEDGIAYATDGRCAARAPVGGLIAPGRYVVRKISRTSIELQEFDEGNQNLRFGPPPQTVDDCWHDRMEHRGTVADTDSPSTLSRIICRVFRDTGRCISHQFVSILLASTNGADVEIYANGDWPAHPMELRAGGAALLIMPLPAIAGGMRGMGRAVKQETRVRDCGDDPGKVEAAGQSEGLISGTVSLDKHTTEE